ncbi:sigma factor-like helix-turn-helix DNA-binding protein [Vibrio tritonius]|uniref:sigma factor-like helix-turn-helix DNA-binding protein n=1 Tax=Vibrio tritonius TaxID=1435069 RepID=UPI000838A61C|nr:sigma factor-like helix-turn-helix DNA-binding protein [Vibrio tritonius]
MSSLKLYLIIIDDGKAVETIVFRDLGSLELGWKERSNNSLLGIVHIGFVRPKIKFKQKISPVLLGNIIVTSSVKWALPGGYVSTDRPAAILNINQDDVPSYLITNGFGYELELSQYENILMPESGFSVSKQSDNSSRYTIVEAAQKVIKKVGKPLNKEEIFAHIIQDGLYDFKATRPIDVLDVELNRYSFGSHYSKVADSPCFSRTADHRYFLSGGQNIPLASWVKNLNEYSSDIANQLMVYGIYDDASFCEKFSLLPSKLLAIADVYRYKELKEVTKKNDPHLLLNIIPKSILTKSISKLGFSVRLENVFISQGFEVLSELLSINQTEMFNWPNFGKKSNDDFCLRLIELADNLEYSDICSRKQQASINELESRDELGNAENSKVENKTLKEYFESTLSKLKDKDRMVIELRTGFQGPALTLQATGKEIGVTRERVRQIQKKNIDKIIREESWDDVIAVKVGQILATRTEPLYLEMLELEDEWFKGFISNYEHLAAILEIFSEQKIRVIKINGFKIVTRISQDEWEQAVSYLRKSLKDKAEEKLWQRRDIEVLIMSQLESVGALELNNLLFNEFNELLQFTGDDDNAILVSYGKSAESAVAAVLEQAESPLHYSEVAIRATEQLGKKVDERRAQNALQAQGAKLYGRGMYGLERFNPISERMCNNIRLVVKKMMYEGPLKRQWHSSGLLKALQEKFPSLPEELDTYILNIILEKDEQLTYLNRMVWARSDSNQSPEDRIDMAEAFTKFLEENGAPMKGSELRDTLREFRGVGEIQQIQPNDRMIQVGPDLWGLVERDIGSTEEEISKALDCLEAYLNKTQKGIHVSEVDGVLKCTDLTNYPEPYTLLNLAQRDKRFHLVKAMFLGLASWGDDVRRMNFTQAVKWLSEHMSRPMTIGEINLKISEVTGLNVDGTVTGLLLNNGFKFDKVVKKWALK